MMRNAAAWGIHHHAATAGIMQGSGAGLYDPYLVYDTFTDTNGTALASHTPEKGGPWTLSGGVIDVQSNAAKYASGAAHVVGTVPVTTANGYMQATLVDGATREYGVIINAQSSTESWMAWRSGPNSVILYERSGGSFTNRGTAVATPATLKIEANGDTIKVYGNGVEIISYTVGSRPYKASAVSGIQFFTGCTCSLDNAQAGAL